MQATGSGTESTYTSTPVRGSLMVRLWTWVMVSIPILDVMFLMRSGSTRLLLAKSANLVIGKGAGTSSAGAA